MRTVVLVHGLWHGSWCWSPVATRLAARGIPSVAVDLDGHGLKSAATAGVTATTAAATLVEQIRRIGDGEPCLVVAHSMGGAVATAAAEQAPELFSRLFSIAAHAPVSGRPAVFYLNEPESAGDRVLPLLVGDPALTGVLRLGLDDRAAVREAFYGDVDAITADSAIDLLAPAAPVGIAADVPVVTREGYGSVPKTYVVCTKDNAVPPALQRRLIGEIDAVSASPAEVIELDSSHSPMLSHPDDLTTAIASAWAG